MKTNTSNIPDMHELEIYMSAVNYPATKSDIIRTYEKLGGDINILTLLQLLPDHEYNNPHQVREQIRV